ncbi:ABC transporter permease subunit, partial [Achromobacter sp. SIMBA_011]|uniref:ABC transporter permease subunit n=1 Tax=Achromobacter sp. SIMBA_011 TaxID=3085759 RepID=UPI00397B7161
TLPASFGVVPTVLSQTHVGHAWSVAFGGALVVLLAAFGWITLSDYVRSEFLQKRALDYVRAARTLGLSDWQIMWR